MEIIQIRKLISQSFKTLFWCCLSYWSSRDCLFFLFVNISASKGFRKPDCYAWERKEKTNWTIEGYRRWNWISRSWGMAALLCTVLLYLACFYCNSKWDLVVVPPWDMREKLDKPSCLQKWIFIGFLVHFINTWICLTSEKQKHLEFRHGWKEP